MRRGEKVRSLPRKFAFLGLEGRNLRCPGIFCRDVREPGGIQKVSGKKSAHSLPTPTLPKALHIWGLGGLGRRGGGNL